MGTIIDIINEVLTIANVVKTFNNIIRHYIGHSFICDILTRRALSFQYTSVEEYECEHIEITSAYCKDARYSFPKLTEFTSAEYTLSIDYIPTLLIFTNDTNILDLIKKYKLSEEARKIINLLLSVRERMKDFLAKIDEVKYTKPYHNLLHVVRNVKSSSYITYLVCSKQEILEYVLSTYISDGKPKVVFEIFKNRESQGSISLEFSEQDKSILLNVGNKAFICFYEDGRYNRIFDVLGIPDKELKKIGKYIFAGLPKEIKEVKILEPVYMVINQVSKTITYFAKYIILLNEVFKEIMENAREYYFIISEIV